MTIAPDVTGLIGATPLVELDSFAPNLVGKVEAFNPGGSVKDRIGAAMLQRAKEQERIDEETTIIEPTSGNTGIGLALTAAAKGYDLVLTMPDSMSEERRKLLAAYGAELVLTPGEEGMNGAIDRAYELAEERENTFVPQQFANEANPWVHRETTGPELWEATDGELDVLVAGVGTGGTVTGISEYFEEEQGADLRTVAVEPAESAVLSGDDAGSHGIQGIGAGFVPDVLRTKLVDDVRTVERPDAVAAARRLAESEGILAGISSGAALSAAATVATSPDHEDDLVAAVLPDTGERYLSTDLFEAEAEAQPVKPSH